MSKKEEPKAKDVELKPLSRKVLEDQIKKSQQVIEELNNLILRTQRDVEQNIGVLDYTKFLLQRYTLAPEPEEPKKTPLEVK